MKYFQRFVDKFIEDVPLREVIEKSKPKIQLLQQ